VTTGNIDRIIKDPPAWWKWVVLNNNISRAFY